MLTPEQNELLCRVGPATPMGKLLRRYWIPALLSNELERDGAPVRLRLLGEDLVAFRSTSGGIGLLANACAHRGASLFFGRNEAEGLRCAYHGWKFDCSGRCVDMPNVPREHNFAHKVQSIAYTAVERNGLIWAYLGPRPIPPLPSLEPNLLTDRPVAVRRIARKCNWVQALEGDLDASHLGFAHRRPVDDADLSAGVPKKYEAIDTEVGSSFACLVETPKQVCFWLISHFLFPFYTMVPFGGLGGHEIVVRCWVPLDDVHTLFWDMSVLSDAVEKFLEPSSVEFMPATSDPLTRFVPVQNAKNDYLIDRGAQRSTSFMGLENVTVEDMAVTESMGPIVDRSREHLGFADSMIIRARRRLLDAARALDGEGAAPPGIDAPDAYRRRAVKMILSRDADVFAAAEALISKPRR